MNIFKHSSRQTVFFILIILLFISFDINAYELDLIALVVKTKEAGVELANKRREKIKNRIDLTIDRINHYFFKDKDYGLKLEDEVQFRYEILKIEHNEIKYKTKINANFHFPSVSLIMDNYRRDQLPGAQLSQKDEEVNTGLRHYLLKLEKRVLALDYGVRVHDKEPVAFTRLKWINRDIDLNKLKFHFSQSLFWYSDDGKGELSNFDLDYNVNEKLFLRTALSALYSEVSNGFELEQSFIFSYHIQERGVNLFARVSGFAHTEPDFDIDKYETNIIYRRQLITPWLFYDIAPQAEFPADNDFKLVPGIKLGIDALF